VAVLAAVELVVGLHGDVATWQVGNAMPPTAAGVPSSQPKSCWSVLDHGGCSGFGAGVVGDVDHCEPISQ